MNASKYTYDDEKNKIMMKWKEGILGHGLVASEAP